jgi:hypothetical protein
VSFSATKEPKSEYPKAVPHARISKAKEPRAMRKLAGRQKRGLEIYLNLPKCSGRQKKLGMSLSD